MPCNFIPAISIATKIAPINPLNRRAILSQKYAIIKREDLASYVRNYIYIYIYISEK